MISKEEVEKIAKLARIDLTASEIEKFQKDLSIILDYVEMLKELDKGAASPMSRSINIENVMREDEIKDELTQKKIKSLAAAPEIKDGYLKVKSIL